MLILENRSNVLVELFLKMEQFAFQNLYFCCIVQLFPSNLMVKVKRRDKLEYNFVYWVSSLKSGQPGSFHSICTPFLEY